MAATMFYVVTLVGEMRYSQFPLKMDTQAHIRLFINIKLNKREAQNNLMHNPLKMILLALVQMFGSCIATNSSASQTFECSENAQAIVRRQNHIIANGKTIRKVRTNLSTTKQQFKYERRTDCTCAI